MRALVRVPLILLLLSVGALANAASRETCSEVKLTQRPDWASSGAWTANGDLLIADAHAKVILRYSKTGRALGTIPETIGSTLGQFFPQMIRSQQGKLFLEVWGNGLIVMDQDFAPLSSKDVHAKSSRPEMKGVSVEGMFLWEPIGNDVISFSDLHGPKASDWSSGFVRFPADKPQDFTILRDMKFEDSSRIFYRLGHPYITTLGNTGYILLMDSKMEIAKVTKHGLERLSAFPAGLDLSPQLPSFTTFDDMVPVLHAVERSTMPTGLYGWENALFVLWRKAEGRGTHWYLTKIDPQNDRVLGTVSILKTSANHLSVVPGPNSWAFIEKGPVRGYGVQDIDSLLLVPAAKLRAAFRPGADLCQ
jgi:hypothetical protein